MCNALPRPRCHHHSSAKLTKLDAGIASAKSALDAALRERNKIASSPSPDYNKFVKARKAVTVAENQLAALETERRHVQRDVDGTKTGLKALETQLKSASSVKEIRELELRIAQADTIRENREHAARVKADEAAGKYRFIKPLAVAA